MPNVLSATDLAGLAALVADIAFDKVLPVYHPVAPVGDGYGHTVEQYNAAPDLLLSCYVGAGAKLLTGDQLALYADIIAGKQLLVLYFAPGEDVREGDRVVYQGKNWRAVPVAADSFSVTDRALIVTVA